MYRLSDFIPYTDSSQLTNGSQIVLAWSKESGYHFVEFGFIFNEMIIAVKDL